MYIKKVKILGFGKWVDKEFEFQSDLQIIRGANESGKTTLLAFIKSILFGFASGKQKYDQYLPKDSSQYGGELTLVDDKDTWLIRRKKGKFGGDVTLYKNDLEVPNSLLDQITKSMSKDLYETTYGINHKNIDNFNELTKDQLITEVLTVGAVNSSQWLNYSQALDKSSGEIYKPTGKNPELNKKLKEYDELIKQKDDYENQKDLYQKYELEKNKNTKLLTENVKKQEALNNKLIELKQYINQEKDYLELKDLKGQLTDNNRIKISEEDWDTYTLNKEKIKVLSSRKNELINRVKGLTYFEQEIITNYENNHENIDEISNQIDSLNKKIFVKEQLEEKILKQNKDLLNLQQDFDLNTDYTPLTNYEIKILSENEQNSNKNSLFMASIGILIILFSIFIPAIKYVGIILGLIVISYFGIQWNNSSNNKNNSVLDIINQRGYEGLSTADVLNMQPQVQDMIRIKSEIEKVEKELTDLSNDINSWSNKLYEFKIIKNQQLNIEEIRNYFNNLTLILNKKNLIIKEQQENELKVSEIDQNLEELINLQNTIFNKYNETTEIDFEDQKNKEDLLKEKYKRYDVLKETLSDYKKYLNTNNINSEDLYTIRDKTQLELNEVSQIILDINDKLAQIKLSLESLVNDNKYLKLQREIDDTAARIIELFDDWAAQKLASKWIYETLNLASSNRFPKMLKRTIKYFEIMTNGSYKNIDISNKTIKVQNANKQKFLLGELSKGTIAQLFIALRSSFVMEISDIIQLPILIDDAFNDFDSIRLTAALKLVEEMSKENQIIFVTTDVLSKEYFKDEKVINL